MVSLVTSLTKLNGNNYMEAKIYKIADKDFILNTDLDLDEREIIQSFFGKTVRTGQTINFGEFRKDEVVKLYSIILKPADGNELPPDFSLSKIKESVELDLIKDFFLSRMLKMPNLAESLSNLTGQPSGQQTN